ncbi:MAG: hypothetical protein HKN33_15805 [Pyrinomonadaceae bacterium]|nr:hypothetical protein [Pyrinomonadaceae bacterium]
MRISVVLLLLILCCISGVAQTARYSIEIELEDLAIDRKASEETLKVSITNKSDERLSGKQLGNLELEFSKCGPGERDSIFCTKKSAKYFSRVAIPDREVPDGEKLVFRVNIASLYWSEIWLLGGTKPRYGNWAPSLPNIPDDNVYFFAKIRSLEGYRSVPVPDSDKPEKRPVWSFEYSNVINVAFI